MNITAYKELLTRFLTMTETEVLNAFGALKGAVRTRDYVFIEGRRKDRILLVAHADTAGNLGKPVWHGDAATTYLWGLGWDHKRESIVLGADDRAGCALLYNIYDGEHSVLITTGEERGCIGAKIALKELADQLERHQFALQIDRRGDRQAVFYQCGTEAFQKWMMAQLEQYDYNKVPWSNEPGSWTDVAEICPPLGICGVNLSAGYRNEHSTDEILLLGSWLHTRTVVRRLTQQTRLPQFLMQKVKRYEVHPSYGANAGSGSTGRSSTPTRDIKKAGQIDLYRHGGQELCVVLGDQRIPVNSLSKKQRKALIKGVKRRFAAKEMDMEKAISLMMLLVKPGENVREILQIPETITEEDRLEHWTGDTWTRMIPDPNDKVRFGEVPKTIVTRIMYCVHGTMQGRYCDRCVGTVPGSTPRAVSGGGGDLLAGKCDHGISLKQHCVECWLSAREAENEKTRKAEAARREAADNEAKSGRAPRLCKHGQSLYLLCTDCEVEIAMKDVDEEPTCIHHVPASQECKKCLEPSAERLVVQQEISPETPKVVVPLPLLPPRRSLRLISRGDTEIPVHDKVTEGFRLAEDGTCSADH